MQTRPYQPRLDSTARHWIAGRAQTTHCANAFHLVFPAGERGFCDVFRRAAQAGLCQGSIEAEMRVFVQQEARHARSHADAQRWITERWGLDTRRSSQRIERTFGTLLRRGPTTGRAGRATLRWQLALVAGFEHFTSALGAWMFDTCALAQADCDRDMLELFLWHCAEEVEHRSVAFDAHRCAQKRFGHPTRVVATTVAFVVGWGMWADAATSLIRAERAANGGDGPGRISLRTLRDDIQSRYFPSPAFVTRSLFRAAQRSHDPRHDGHCPAANAFLATLDARAA